MSLDLVSIRRDLHQHPETAFHEFRTADVIESILRSLGLAPRRVARTGVVADVVGKEPGPIVALRADTDALPVTEKSGVAFASVHKGVMHACGHDTHISMLLGAAERLVDARHQIGGSVRLLFQPAEETTEGAKEMVAAGALDGVSAIFGLHNYPGLPVGQVALCSGALMASSDHIMININGQGGHAASPHLTTDPLVAAAAVLSGLQAVVSRAVNPLEPLVVTIGRMQGGTTFNVIPESAELEGTVRCFNPQLRASMPALLSMAVSSIAQGYRCSAHLSYHQMVPAVHNHGPLTNTARSTAIRLLGEQNVVDAQPTMGAEDFAIYQEHVPGCFFWIGSGGEHNWHHPEFNIDERMLPIGADLLHMIAVDAIKTL